MQMHSSYVVTDPKGTILVECGKMLQRGAPKLGKDGKPNEIARFFIKKSPALIIAPCNTAIFISVTSLLLFYVSF